ncbi:MAG: PAS domain S-box protein [Planctomycetota bacterium]|nr:PAS domain S-box protein [Planctomycetota bacterium]MDA1112998.1 PAS domain S-box protein [Planctomycetota bacterium]
MTFEKETPVAPWQYLVVALCQLGLGALGHHFYLGQDYVSLGWPAMGIGAGFLAIWGLRVWWSVFAASLVSQFFFLHPYSPVSFVFTAGESGEILLAGYLLTKGLDWRHGLRNVRQLRRGAFVGLVAPVLGAALGTFALWASPESEKIPGPAHLEIFSQWWMRSAVGFMMISPIIGAWRLRPRLVFGPNPMEGLILSILVSGLCLLSFSELLNAYTVPIWTGLLAGCLLLWCGARCGLFLTSHLAVLVLLSASFAALEQSAIFERVVSGDLRALWWGVLNVCALGSITLSVFTARAIQLSTSIAAARNRLELLVQNSPLALVEWDLDFRIRVWSRKAGDIFGYSEEEVIGKSGLDLLVPVEERVRFSDQWFKLVKGQDGVRNTNHNRTASGETLLCDWYGSPVYDEQGQVVGVVAMVENVTDREVAAESLLASERRFQTIAEVIPQAVSYYSTDLECLYGNSVFLDCHSLTQSQLPLAIREMTSPEDWERISPILETVRSGRAISYLEVVVLADGEKHDFDRALLPDLGSDGVVRGFFSVGTDVTQYRKAAAEKLALETQVLQTQKLEGLSMLSGRIAHEFNNRLFGILGHADIARKDLVKSPMIASESLDRVISIAREASELCRQLFVFSGFGTGEKLLTDAKPFVLEMRRLLELTIPSNIRLRTRFEEHQEMFLADHAQLRQALVNIVQNAAQAIGKDRGEIVVSSRLVSISQCDFIESFLAHENMEQSLIEICITDNGEGVPENEIRQNFEPFFTRRQGARGLGLAGVLGIIHGHSGAIAMESEVGKGTSVKLYFVAQQKPSEVADATGCSLENLA